MNPILMALALSVQAQTPPGQESVRNDFPPRREPSPAHGVFHEEERRASGVPARRAMQAFGSCIADRSPGLAVEALTIDFTTPTYSNRLRQLARNNPACFRQSGVMRSGGLGLAGAMAERLIELDPTPLNARLARAAQGPAATAYSATDRVAMCVVRSVPDQVAGLFASEVGSAEEAAAARLLEPAVVACNQAGTRFTVTTAGARSMLATAAFRTLRGATATARRD